MWLKMAKFAFTEGLCQPCKTTEVHYRAGGALDGINKDMCDAKLHPTAVLAYPVDCDCWCHLLDTHCCCMSPNGTLNPPLASHPPRHSLTPLYMPSIILQSL